MLEVQLFLKIDFMMDLPTYSRPEELKKKNLGYGQNKRSSEHLKLYGDKPFDKEIHQKYLNHENIEKIWRIRGRVNL